MTAAQPAFNPAQMFAAISHYGHTGALGLTYVDHGDNMVAMALPWKAALVGDVAAQTPASGAVIALLDMTAGMSVWTTLGHFRPMATLDLRIDYLRAAHPQSSIVARVECYRVARDVCFVRGIAHDGDASDPVAHMAASFMFLGPPMPHEVALREKGRRADDPANGLPPYAGAMGIAVRQSPGADAAPVLAMPFANCHSGRPGHLHGGAIAGLLDMAAHAALVHTLAQAGQSTRYKPIGMTIDYVRGGKEVATFARGRVTRVGSRVATVIVEAWQEEGGPQIAAARMHILLSRDAA